MTHNGVSLPGPHNISRTQLDNGITVLVYENHSAQSIVITGALRGGSLFESAAQNGLASITASALMRGTHERDFNAIHAGLEDIGATLHLSAGVHKTGFSGKALAEDLPVLTDLLDDVLRNPAFPTQQVERLRGEILTGLQYRQQDTRYRARRAFHEALYAPEHPYHRNLSGTLETVPELTLESMRDFHRKYYGPAGMILVIVGDVEAQQALDTVRERLGDWRNPMQADPPGLPDAPPPSETRQVEIKLAGKTQSDLMLGFVGPSRYAENYQAANLANSILGEFGMMGRIGQVVREEAGYAYYAYSRIEGGFSPGPWHITAGVNPANLEDARARIIAEVQRITTETVSDDDLADNQAYFTGQLPLQLESNEGVAEAIHTMEKHNLGLDYLLNYRDMIYNLTKDDLMAAAQQYLNPNAYVLAVAGPDETIG